MPNYCGIYGIGYLSEDKNRLELLLGGASLIRDKLENGNYDVSMVFGGSDNDQGFQLLENITLKEWRRFFIKYHRGEKIKEIEEAEKSLIDQEGDESFDLEELDQLSFL